MTPRHHLDAATLVSYSAGALPVAFRAVTAAHLGLCRECRGQLLEADRVGGWLLAQSEPAALPQRARDALLARLDQPPATAPRPAPAVAQGSDGLPPPLQPYFGPTLSGVHWRLAGPGVRLARARADAAPGLILLSVAPGRSLPAHGHGGSELTLILRGAYEDELGRFAEGDVADLDADTRHRPVTARDGPCICAAALDAPLSFSGWLARALQPLVGL